MSVVDDLCSAGEGELPKDGADVGADGVLSEVGPASDFAVAEASGEVEVDLLFAWAEYLDATARMARQRCSGVASFVMKPVAPARVASRMLFRSR